MCEKCTKRAIGRIIVDAEAKLQKAFTEIEKNPNDLSKDESTLSLLNKMAELLEKYEKIK